MVPLALLLLPATISRSHMGVFMLIKTSCLVLVLALSYSPIPFASEKNILPSSPPFSTFQVRPMLPIEIDPPSARQVRQWERHWQKHHRKALSSPKWALSYDIIEVVSAPNQSVRPLLPHQDLKRDPQAEISRLAITQVVNKDKDYHQTVFADLTMAYLLEVVSSPPKKEDEKLPTDVSSHQPSIQPTVYAYSFTPKGMLQVVLPASPTTQGILELASTSESLWDLIHANPKLVTVLQWDQKGRPKVAFENDSPDKDYIFYSYKEELKTPYLLQTTKMLESGHVKSTTVLINETSYQFEKPEWQRESIIKSAALAYLLP